MCSDAEMPVHPTPRPVLLIDGGIRANNEGEFRPAGPPPPRNGPKKAALVEANDTRQSYILGARGGRGQY